MTDSKTIIPITSGNSTIGIHPFQICIGFRTLGVVSYRSYLLPGSIEHVTRSVRTMRDADQFIFQQNKLTKRNQPHSIYIAGTELKDGAETNSPTPYVQNC